MPTPDGSATAASPSAPSPTASRNASSSWPRVRGHAACLVVRCYEDCPAADPEPRRLPRSEGRLVRDAERRPRQRPDGDEGQDVDHGPDRLREGHDPEGTDPEGRVGRRPRGGDELTPSDASSPPAAGALPPHGASRLG